MLDLATNIGTAAGVGGFTLFILWKIVQRLETRLEDIIVPKVSNLCLTTQRIEVAQSHIIGALESDGHPNIRNEILDEIDLRGIPRLGAPISNNEGRVN